MKKIEFTCPECGSHRLDEVKTGVTIKRAVTSITEPSFIDCGEPRIANHHVDYYQCASCDFFVRNEQGKVLYDGKSLIQWIKNKKLEKSS